MNCLNCDTKNSEEATYCINCGAKLSSKQPNKKLKTLFTIIVAIILILIGILIPVIQSQKAHEKHLEEDVAAVESSLFNNGGTKIDDIVDDFQDTYTAESDNSTDSYEVTEEEQYLSSCYTKLWHLNQACFYNNELTDSEEEQLIQALDTLIDALKKDYINTMTLALSVYSDSGFMDTMTELVAVYYNALDECRTSIVSYWDESVNNEYISETDTDNFDKEMDYLKGLSITE